MCARCHLFFASMSTNREALIYNLVNGAKERKGRTREARHTVYLITLQQSQEEPGADYGS